jgi:hypothetical protein
MATKISSLHIRKRGSRNISSLVWNNYSGACVRQKGTARQRIFHHVSRSNANLSRRTARDKKKHSHRYSYRAPQRIARRQYHRQQTFRPDFARLFRSGDGYRSERRNRQTSGQYWIRFCLRALGVLPKIAYVEEIIPILTDLFDGKKSFRQKTRSGGLIELTNPLITMLAGSTADWLETNIPVNAYGGGFLSRIIFVYANRKSKDVPLPELTPKIKRLRLELAAELTWINANMGGDVVWTPEAKEWYVRFYGSWDPNDDPGNSVQKGYRNRRTEHLLRVAIVFAVSQKRNLILDVDALVAADEALKIIEVHMAKCFENAAPQMAFSKTYRMVLDFIEEKGPCTKRQITRALWRHINAAELSMCIQTLDDAGLIKTTTSGQTITYEYQPMKIP